MRDKYTQEMEEYFTSGKFAIRDDKNNSKRWSLVTDQERSLIVKEVEVCRSSFVHTCENWFWISDKSGRETLMFLWDGQLLVYEKMLDMKKRGKPQWVLVIKSRQLGMSQFGCALAAWKTMFHSSQRALVVSEDDDKTESNYNNYIVPIYRKLPWFLQPTVSSLSLTEGIKFNTDAKKSQVVGLESEISLQSANATSFLQGKRLNLFHGSEFTSWPNFIDIVERGAENAMPEEPETIGLMESTAKGAGTITHQFWNKMRAKGENAKWETVFLPYFFDKKHVLSPPQGWIVPKEYKKKRDLISVEWVRCDNKKCLRYLDSNWGNIDRAETKCHFCNTGTLKPFIISDEQLYWINFRVENATDLDLVKQEQASSAEEAFRVTGDKVFSDQAIEFATICAEKASRSTKTMKGFIDQNGRFHAYTGDATKDEIKCFIPQCKQDHRGEEFSLTVYEPPIPGATYAIGADIGEGVGKDYTVFVVSRIASLGGQDKQVARFRSNAIIPYNAAGELNKLGRWYNDAQIAVEYAGSAGGSTADTLLNLYQYPNVYRRKISGDFHRSLGQGYHWLTNVGSKPKLIETARRWLKDELYYISDLELVKELKVFVREENKTEAKKSNKGDEYHDDCVMAWMICLYTAHQNDYDEENGIAPLVVERTPENSPYKVSCNRCHYEFGISDPRYMDGTNTGCPKCNCIVLTIRQNVELSGKNPITNSLIFDSFDEDPNTYQGYW